MKRIWLGVLAGCVAGLAVAGEGRGFRTFTDTQGRTIQAKMVAFDAVEGRVSIEREDGRRNWVNPELFCEADREYIRHQLFAERFPKGECLAVSVEKKAFLQEAVCYEVTLKNRTSDALENLYMDYRMYSGQQASDIVHSVGMDQFIGSIPPNGEKRIRPPAHVFVDETPIGVWLRIYSPEANGERLVYEVSFPEKLRKRYSWDEDARNPVPVPYVFTEVIPEHLEGVRNLKEKNVQKAIEQFEIAAQKGEAMAYCYIATIYRDGSQVDRDWVLAVDYYQKAFDAEMLGVGLDMAELYFKGGNGLQKNDELGLEWLRRGAAKEHPD